MHLVEWQWGKKVKLKRVGMLETRWKTLNRVTEPMHEHEVALMLETNWLIGGLLFWILDQGPNNMGTWRPAEKQWVDMAWAEFGIPTKEQGDLFLTCQEKLQVHI